jgi:hypothetical protein
MNTNEDLMSDLINNARSAKHRQFQFLVNYKEYSRAKQIRRGLALLVSSIKQSTNKLFKSYCKDVASGGSDINRLLAYCTARQVLEYYEEELRIITEMVVEYECYLANGNWLDFVLGVQRPIDKLWDHRGK